MSGELTGLVSTSGLAFSGFAAAAVAFCALILWRSRSGVRLPAQRLLLAGFAMTACWAWLSAVGPGSTIAGLAETFRNLVWLGLLHSLSGGREAVERYFAEIENLIGDGWLAGDAFTAADSYVLTFFRWGVRVGIGIDAFPKMAALTGRVLGTWVAGVRTFDALEEVRS